ncbi:hypothetical protein LEP1GSC196_1421 [Leptospira meyeri serovar Semaranga str. Veldrot Semarang 173]|nr:hypothetical protein LEP1GSC196_1421 [Leptospira meyeri serovar Semaranga str. Veldrot Semarang 173]
MASQNEPKFGIRTKTLDSLPMRQNSRIQKRESFQEIGIST